MRNIRIILKALSTLSAAKLLKLSKLVFVHPLFSILGVYATLRAFSLAQKHFPDSHSNNGIGNAFRHALWTSMIAMYCSKISSPKKAIRYAVEMTNLHEELFPNKPLEKKMDLHNNQIGIQFFEELLPTIHRQFFETSFLVEGLKKKIKNAKVLTNTSDDLSDDLVYLQK